MTADASRMPVACARAGVDALLTASPEMARFLTGTSNPVRSLLTERPLLVLWPSGGVPMLVAPLIESPLLASASRIRTIRYYSARSEIVTALAAAVADAGLAGSRIGAELAAIPAKLFRELTERLPSIEFTDESEAINSVRAIKDEREVSSLERAAQATRRAQLQALEAFELDWSETRLADTLRRNLVDAGAESVSFLTIGSSGRNAHVHSVPADQRLRPGDLLRMDFGGIFDGWHSDLAMTAGVVSAGAQHSRLYSDLARILASLIARLRPGLAAADAYRSVRDDFTAAGLELKAPHVGHGIGLSVHEFPFLDSESEAVIEAGMVLCVELVHLDGRADRYHLEETVWVGPDKTRILSQVGKPVLQLPLIGAAGPAILREGVSR